VRCPFGGSKAKIFESWPDASQPAPTHGFYNIEAIPMLRLIVINLLQWFKRLATSSSQRNAQNSRNFAREDNDGGRWTFVSIVIAFTLSLYVVAGLGFFAKVHMWDTLTVQEKASAVQAMTVSTEYM